MVRKIITLTICWWLICVGCPLDVTTGLGDALGGGGGGGLFWTICWRVRWIDGAEGADCVTEDASELSTLAAPHPTFLGQSHVCNSWLRKMSTIKRLSINLLRKRDDRLNVNTHSFMRFHSVEESNDSYNLYRWSSWTWLESKMSNFSRIKFLFFIFNRHYFFT